MKRTHLPLNGLRVLDAAARHLSFTRAADELAVTPAAVGQHIRALEEMLGVVLFKRSGRALELTAQGYAALPALREGFLKFEEAVAVMQAGQASDIVTVAARPSFAARWLAPRLAAFHQAHTNVTVRLFADQAPVDFAQDNLDLAIHFGQEPPPDCIAAPLAEDAIAPVSAPAFAGADPLGVPLIHDDLGDGIDDPATWPAWFARQALNRPDAHKGLRVNIALVAIEAALAGHGVALARLRLVDADLANGRLIIPFGTAEPIPGSYWLAAPEPQWRLKKVQALVRWLQATRADPTWRPIDRSA